MQRFARFLEIVLPFDSAPRTPARSSSHRSLLPAKINPASRPATQDVSRKRESRSLLVLLLGLLVHTAAGISQNVTTQQYGNARTGVQSQETLLTPANVNPSSFGKLFTLPVSGYVYAQPLYMSGLLMPDGATHNVLFVATEQDYVYAFDADGNNPAQGYLWRDSLLGSNETWGSPNDVNSSNIAPAIGITSTPVIDPATGTLFVVAKSKTQSGSLQYFQRLHALKLTDGTETLNGPTLIQATAPGKAGGGATLAFDPRLGNQRAGLVLASTPNGPSPASVFITWASHGDNGSYHGWVISYSSSDISQRTGVWLDTPNGAKGGIWLAGGALSSDDAGNIFGASGNGTFDANTGGADYGDTAFSLSLQGSTLGLNSYFTPADQSKLANDDLDMGMSSMVLLPAQTGPIPHLALTVDKSGTIYLLNRDNLGGYSGTSNDSMQSFNIGHSIRGSASFFNGTLYMAGEGGPLSAWPFNPQTEQFATTPVTTSTAVFGCGDCDGSGTTPAISANGSSNAIVWVLNNTAHDTGPSILRAYDPVNLQNVFYDSSQAANHRDAAGTAVKWTVPVIVNGHVYVGGVNAVTAYGELGSTTTVAINASPASISPGASSTLTVTASNATQVTVSGSDGSSYTLSPTGGTQKVSPGATTTYTATAVGAKSNATAMATVIVGQPAATVTINANPASISPGASSLLTVTASNATQVTISGSDGSSYTLSATGGTQTVSPGATTTYTATATGAGAKATAAATVTVGQPAATVKISATPASITAGAASVLTVAAANATQVILTGTDGSSYKLSTSGGTQNVTPAATTTYTATATGSNGPVSATATVTVTPGAGGCLPSSPGTIICAPAQGASPSSPVTITAGSIAAVGNIAALRAYIDNVSILTINNPSATKSFQFSQSVTVSPGSHHLVIVGYETVGGGAEDANEYFTVSGSTATTVTLNASPASISAGASSILTVSAANATQVSISGTDGSSYTLPPAGGTQKVSPAATTTYTATAVGSTSNATATTTVTIGPSAATVSLNANPASILAGASSVLTASATNATQVVLNGSDGSSYKLSPSGGTQTVTPAATTTYTATATGNAGAVTATAVVTVTSNTGGCLPSAPGAIICAPAQGASATSPVTITAGAVAASGNIAALRAYIDNVSVLIINNPASTRAFQFSQPVTVSPGNHYLVIVGYETVGGGAVVASEHFTVPGGGTAGCAPSSQGAMICSPGPNATVSSPVTISAGATAATGYVSALRLYVDNVSESIVNNPQPASSFSLNQPLSMSQGSHKLVIVGYLSSGGAVDAVDYITVH